jgi:hypothetical protein
MYAVVAIVVVYSCDFALNFEVDFEVDFEVENSSVSRAPFGLLYLPSTLTCHATPPFLALGE